MHTACHLSLPPSPATVPWPEQAVALAADAEVVAAGWRVEVAASAEEACRGAGLILCVTCVLLLSSRTGMSMT